MGKHTPSRSFWHASRSLQEIEALKVLSDAMYELVKGHAMKYIKAEVIRRTVFANLMSALSPIALLKIGGLIGEAKISSYELSDANSQTIRG